MSETQQKLISPAAAPLQRFYGVVAVSQKYQNFKNGRHFFIFTSSFNLPLNCINISQNPNDLTILYNSCFDFFSHSNHFLLHTPITVVNNADSLN